MYFLCLSKIHQSFKGFFKRFSLQTVSIIKTNSICPYLLLLKLPQPETTPAPETEQEEVILNPVVVNNLSPRKRSREVAIHYGCNAYWADGTKLVPAFCKVDLNVIEETEGVPEVLGR